MDKALIWLLVVLAATPVSTPVSARDLPAAVPTATVTPSSARPGDAIYVSGGSFPSGVNLHAFMACPAWFDKQSADAWALGGVPWESNKTGSFAALKLAVPTPSQPRRTSCTLYVGTAARPFQVAVPFTILGPQDARSRNPLPLSVHLQPGRSGCRRGLTGTVQSAGGAAITVRVSGAHGYSQHRTVSLPWTGRALLRLASSAPCGQRVRVVVQARLGQMTAKRHLVLPVLRMARRS